MDNAGAVMLAAAYTDLNDASVILDLDDAGALLVGEDGWPYEVWPFTNDAEEYLRSTTMAFPHMFVINLETMEVISAREGVFGSNGYDDVQDLIDTISAL